MRRQRGISIIELIVIFAALALLLAIFMPATGKDRHIAQQVVCGTNLKGLGNAQVVYANDYDGQYACQGGGADHTWAEVTDGWMDPEKDWSLPGNITVSSSLYLLVRQADVSPKSFVCPSSDQSEFSGKNPSNLDIVDLWDFGQSVADPEGRWEGEGPAKCVSYAYHQPYNPAGESTGKAWRYRADDQRSAAFAIMADRNPWYDPKLAYTEADSSAGDYKGFVTLLTNHWDQESNRKQIRMANSQPHKKREGQNVLYADGHSNFEKLPDVGVKNDNIYTRVDREDAEFSLGNMPEFDQAIWRRGRAIERPDRQGADETPACLEDSLLVNDFVGSVR